ncbi:MAG: S9 family peptidase, partial [Flavobacteriaceae bacterium]|nr:S9 family peptidase [Flavobacteriaceae bacterium]
MKLLFLSRFLLLFFTATTLIHAQQKEITLQDIWSGTFRTQGLDVLRSLDNGKEYSVLNYDRSNNASTIDVYEYKSGEKVRTLINSQQLSNIEYIISYEFSDDEKKLLISTQLQQIYRRSTLGTYYVYDLESKELTRVSEEKIQEPTFSKDGTRIAYGLNNDLFIKDLTSGTTQQIT